MKKNKLLVVALVPLLCACSFSADKYTASQFKKLYDEQIAPKAKSDFAKGDQITFTKHSANGTSMEDVEYSLKTKDYAAYKERFEGTGNPDSPLWKDYLGGGISFASRYTYTLGSIVMEQVIDACSLAYEQDEGKIKEDQTIDGKTEKVDVGTFVSETYTYSYNLVKNVPDEKGEYTDFEDSIDEDKYTVREEKDLDGKPTSQIVTIERNSNSEYILGSYQPTYFIQASGRYTYKLKYVETREYKDGVLSTEPKIEVRLTMRDEYQEGKKPIDSEGNIGELAVEHERNATKTIVTRDDGTYLITNTLDGVTTSTESNEPGITSTDLEGANPIAFFQEWDNDTNINMAIEGVKTVYRQAYTDAETVLNSTGKEKECLVKGDIAVIRIKQSNSTMVEYQFDKKTGQPTRIVSYGDVDFNKLGAYTIKEDASFVY